MTQQPSANNLLFKPSDYNAFMRSAEKTGFVEIVQEELGKWLREKQFEVRVEQDLSLNETDRKLAVKRHHRDDGRDDLRAVLVERGDQPTGDYRTELLASADGWVNIRVINTMGSRVDTPRLARKLLQRVDLGDSGVDYRDEPIRYGPQDVSALIKTLTNPQRESILFVVGSDKDNPDLFDPLLEKLSTWSRNIVGMAQIVVLDPPATREFGKQAGFHAVAPWSIRTYLPGVELGDVADARRHRFLSTKTLAFTEDWRLRQMLTSIVRSQTAKRVEPTEVRGLRRTFERLEIASIEAPSRKRVDTSAAAGAMPEQTATPSKPDGISATPTGVISETPSDRAPDVPLAPAREGGDTQDEPATLSALQEELAIARAFFESAKITPLVVDDFLTLQAIVEEETAAKLNELQDEKERLEDSVADLSRDLADVQLDAAITHEDWERRAAEVDWLRKKLAEKGDYDSAYGEAEKETRPDTFTELLAMLSAASDDQIVFTGEENKVLEVEDADQMDVFVNTAWDSILALIDYLRARENGLTTAGVHEYLEHTPQGYRGLPVRKHARGESGTTKRQFGDERVCRVPEDVAPDGWFTMVAHFKLGSVGSYFPRMHYYDHRPSGRIYIGYIGPHLTNTLSARQ